MKFILTAQFPPEPFNSLVREGKAGEIIQRIMQELKPEHVYFTEIDGCRSALLIFDMQNASDIPKYAEPFFLNFDGEMHLRPAMTPEDLMNANLDAIGQKWG